MDAGLSLVYFLKTLGENLDLFLHFGFKLVIFVFFGLDLLLGILALLDKEEVLLLQAGKDL
jgi:hypothetical protein